MKDALRRLITPATVKSVSMAALTATFVVLSLRGDISGEQFLTIFTVVISFYFGAQAEHGGE